MPERPRQIHAALTRLWADGPGLRAGIGVQTIGPESPPLLRPEALSAARMRPNRRAEFTAGRASARAAMVALGHAPAAIAQRPDRSPNWPKTLRGSISHADGLACALVLPETEGVSAGIDIEPCAPLEADLVESITTERERRCLALRAPAARLIWARGLFAVKEAAYKAQFPLTGAMVEFSDAEVTMTGPHSARARLHPDGAPALTLEARWLHAAGMILALAWIPVPEGQL